MSYVRMCYMSVIWDAFLCRFLSLLFLKCLSFHFVFTSVWSFCSTCQAHGNSCISSLQASNHGKTTTQSVKDTQECNLLVAQEEMLNIQPQHTKNCADRFSKGSLSAHLEKRDRVNNNNISWTLQDRMFAKNGHWEDLPFTASLTLRDFPSSFTTAK